MTRLWVLILLMLMIGCDRKPSAEATDGATAPAAAPDDYLAPTKVTDTKAQAISRAPKPIQTLAANATCLTAECHADFTSAKHIHGPISEKSCNACHGDDMGGHKFPLKRGKTETCTFCHAVAGTQKHQHKPLTEKEGGCVACHEPHVAQTKFLLKADNVEQLCAKCHKTELKKFAHDPFAKGQCTLCHEPHQSASAKLLRGGDGNDHCFTCHAPMKQTFATATSTHKPAMEKCITCHNPHSSEFPRELRATVQQTCLTSGCHEKVADHMAKSPVKHGAMTSDASCASCHNPHASPQKHLLADRADKLCGTCHKPMQEKLAKSEFLHGPIRVGNCEACHDSHGGKNPSLLDRAFPRTFYTSFAVEKYELCFTCHAKDVVLAAKTTTLTNFRNGEVNLHFLHVNRDEKGRSCKSCHEIHGSNQPNHMASEVKFEGSNWAMPLEYRKTERGGSCTPGCHDTKNYDRRGPASSITTINPPTTRGAL
jgi:predicted CXXCH cytochrome family protein